jgi:hypothetical protein
MRQEGHVNVIQHKPQYRVLNFYADHSEKIARELTFEAGNGWRVVGSWNHSADWVNDEPAKREAISFLLLHEYRPLGERTICP